MPIDWIVFFYLNIYNILARLRFNNAYVRQTIHVMRLWTITYSIAPASACLLNLQALSRLISRHASCSHSRVDDDDISIDIIMLIVTFAVYYNCRWMVNVANVCSTPPTPPPARPSVLNFLWVIKTRIYKCITPRRFPFISMLKRRREGTYRWCN